MTSSSSSSSTIVIGGGGGSGGATTFDPGYTIPPSFMNSFRVSAVAERLARLVRPGQRFDSRQFFNLCVTLARGIDYAVANNEVPARAHDLPGLLKQVYQHKNEVLLQAAIMMLMISVKSACKSGWFLVNDADELLNRTNELAMGFCSPGPPADACEPTNLQIMSEILPRFYPWIKMNNVFASVEVEPGFGAYLLDFHITKNKVSAAREKIRLFVAQTDNIETSSCIITPPRVNFLLNGKGIERRTNVSMDNGPQFPTNVTTMVKYGTNLLQAVGHFSGKTIIFIAFTSEVSSIDIPALQDYVRPVSTALDSDAEIIEGPSRISLNCPISFRRIKTPVKGHLCKHHQCFDYENYTKINSRRPSWRCPQCNQSVCHTDIRIDRSMVRILTEVGQNITDVIISEDGSWKPVIETNDSTDESEDIALMNKEDNSNQGEPTNPSAPLTNLVDLTAEGIYANDAMDTSEIGDRKPSKDTAHSSLPIELINTSETQTEDNFWSEIYFSCSNASDEAVALGTRLGSMSESPTFDYMLTPVLTDAVSPAHNRELGDLRETSQASNSLVRSQFQVQNNSLQTFFNDEIVRRPVIPRNVTRTPVAIQALAAPSQATNSQQQTRTSLNSYLLNNSTTLPLFVDGPNAETESPRQHSRSNMNSIHASEMSPSSMQYQQMAQNWDRRSHLPNQPAQLIVGLPAPSRVPGAYRNSPRPSPGPQNPFRQQSSDTRVPQLMSPPTMTRPAPHLPPMRPVQGGSPAGVGPSPGSRNSQLTTPQNSTGARTMPVVPVQLQPTRPASSLMAGDGHRALIGEPIGRPNSGVGNQSVQRFDSLVELPTEQNWRPTGRMRGSLSGRAYSEALSQLIIQPTQPSQSIRPPQPPPPSSSAASSQLPVPPANSASAQAPTLSDCPMIIDDDDLYEAFNLL